MVIYIKDVIKCEYCISNDQFKQVLNKCIENNDFIISFEGIRSLSNGLAIIFDGYNIEMVDCSEGRKYVYERNKKWLENQKKENPNEYKKFMEEQRR